MSTISDKLQELKEKRGISFRKIAQEMGKGESQVQRWFRGENVPGGDALIALAGALGVTVGDITGGPNDHDCARALGLEEVTPVSQREILLIKLHRRLCGHSDALGDHAVSLFEKFLEQLDGPQESVRRQSREAGR